MENDYKQKKNNNTLKNSDRLLPIANTYTIMKKSVPRHAKISKGAKETVQISASEFIAIITSVAKDICISENRKTLKGEDLIKAMKILGFTNYATFSKKILKKYKEGGEKFLNDFNNFDSIFN